MLKIGCAIIALLVGYQSFACDSDCYQCHNHIPTDENHKVLRTCTDCHPEHQNIEEASKCGADCFECHPIKKVVSSAKEHKVLENCIECHKKLKNTNLKNILGD